MLQGKPLAGLRVVSLAQQYPGPFATMLMADLGAEVVQVERAPDGDPARRNAAFFEAINRNKDSVCLDLKSAAGMEHLMELLQGCDIFLEGFRVGAAQRLGLGHERLLEMFPQLIYVSISAFGQDGPYRDRPAHDLSIVGMSGMLWQRAASALEAPYVGHADLVAGMFAAFGAVSALQQRQRTGKGCYLDVAMADCMVSWMTGVVGPAMNGASLNEPCWPGYNSFECADGRWLTLSVIEEDHFWQGLCTAIGRGDLAGLAFEARNARHAELTGVIARAIRSQPLSHWSSALDAAGVAWGPVLSPSEVADDPHFRARDMIVALDTPHGSRRFVSQPLKFKGMRLVPEKGAPDLEAGTSPAPTKPSKDLT